MAKHNEITKQGRKAWSAPEFKRLSAGSAESGGPNNFPDQGGPGDARS